MIAMEQRQKLLQTKERNLSFGIEKMKKKTKEMNK